MKQIRFFTMSFLVLALGLVVGGGPAAADTYMDTFTAEITGVTNSGGGYNPYGLSDGQTFKWYIVYDTATINVAGTVRFTGFYPTNQVSIAIPRDGTSPHIFTQAMDDNYGSGQFDNPYGTFSGGSFIELAYVVNQFPLSSPYSGAISVDYFFNEIWFETGVIGQYSKFDFDPGYENFERQAVPIPGALVLLGSGLAALTILRRRQG